MPAQWVPLHYAILRADLDTCLERATRRGIVGPDHEAPFAELHRRFANLGDHEANVIDATGTPDDLKAAVLAAFWSGGLAL